MSDNYSPRRIARNTLMLYVRMGVMIIITFYTTRVLLQQLGVEDYGIYDVMMGVVTLFAFASNSLTTVTQRFVSNALGREDDKGVTQVFSASLYMYMLMVLISIFLFETVGLWYVGHYVNVPEGRIGAAKIVYQLVIVQFVFLTFRIPYNSAVIAYEKMDFYAYVSIIEAVLALGLIWLLSVFDTDKLILYVILLSLTRVIIFCAYFLYCKKVIPACRLTRYKTVPKETFKEIWSFSGWNIFGSFANTANYHGTNLIVNYFCGVVVNASIGVSNQLTMGLYNLVCNLQTAFNPQIIKLYAAKQFDLFKNLLYRNSKFCFFLFLLILVPLDICIPDVLQLWLGRIPIHSVEICRCMLLFLAVEAMSYPLFVAIQADGNISRYQQVSGALYLILIPVAYVLLKMGLGPVSVFVAHIVQNIIITVYRLFYLRRIMRFDVLGYIRQVLLRCVLVLALSAPVPWILYACLGGGLWNVVVITLVSLLISSIVIFFLGLTSGERDKMKDYVLTKMHRE